MAGQDRVSRHSRKDSETILQDDNFVKVGAIVRIIVSAQRMLQNAKIRDSK